MSPRRQVAILSPSVAEDPSGQVTRKMLSIFSILQWDVLLVTGQDQGEHLSSLQHQPIQVLESFSKWSWSEVPAAAQMLWKYGPDWIHIVTPAGGLLHPLIWLPTLTRPLWPHKISCSLSPGRTLGALDWKRLQPLIRNCDLIWAQSELEKARLSDRLGPDWLKRTPVLLGKCPPAPICKPALPQWLQKLLEEPEASVYISGAVSDHPDPMRLLRQLQRLKVHYSQNLYFIFSGGWGELSLRAKTGLQRVLSQEGWVAHWITPMGLSPGQQDLLRSLCPFFLDSQERLQSRPPKETGGPTDLEINQWLRVLHLSHSSIR